MSKCSISIDIEGDGRCRGGEPVRGVVRVCAHESVRCRGIRLEYRWQTHGRGNTARETLSSQTLHEGALPVGETMELPFEIEVPPLPITYHGHYLNIDHYLEARVDVPLWFDIKEERELLVEAGERPDGGHDDELAARAGKRRNMRGKWTAIIGLAVVLFGAKFVMLFEERVPRIFGLVAAVVGLGIAVVGTRQLLARRALGDIAIEVPSWRVYPGARLPLEVRLRPGAPLALRSVTATLRGRERCVSGSGTNRTTHTHELHEADTAVCGARQLGAREATVIEGEVEIPEGAAFSFAAEDNDIIWELEVMVDIEGWLAWSETRKLVVRPWIIDEIAQTASAEPPPTREENPATAAASLAVAAGGTLDAEGLAALAARLHAAGSDAARDEIVAAAAAATVRSFVEVGRVEPTSGPDVGAEFQGGHSVAGAVSGTDVLIRFPRAHSRSIAMVKPGLALEVRGRVAGYESARGMLAIEADGARIAPRATPASVA